MQVDRATLEKEMEDLGLDMTDKDEVSTVYSSSGCACMHVYVRFLLLYIS